MKTSVVVIAHNEEKYIKQCLDSLLTQTLRPDEVIVLVHNSTDQTFEIAQKYPFNIIKNNWPTGIVPARLESLKHASGEIILCIDGDSYAENNWIQEMTKTLQKGNVLVGSWIKLRGNLFAMLANFFNKKDCINNKKVARFIWGPSMAFYGKDKEKVMEILERSVLLTKELNLSRNPDDYWLALYMSQIGNLEVTNKTYVTQYQKENTFIKAIVRNRENSKNALKMDKFFYKKDN